MSGMRPVRWFIAGAALAGVCWGAACSESSDNNDDSPSSGGSGNLGGQGGSGDGGSGNSPASGGMGGTEEMCPHEGEPVLDPSGLTPCPMCNGGHCIPNALVPAESADSLANCDADNKCVPDFIIETGGNFIPETCESVGGFEGRCLSVCLPAVSEQMDQLPQGACPADHRCAPCYDPFSGEETGACAQSCDPGPVEPPGMFARCCTDRGSCIPASLIPPDQSDQLGQDSCATDMDKCVPDGFADMTFVAQPCSTGTISAIFGSEYEPGACLPDCIPAVDNFLIGQDDCTDGYKCAPCLDPLSGDPSGACDFL
jgi:hypothetical protein